MRGEILVIVFRLFSAFWFFSLAFSQQTAISALADTPLGLRAFPAAERCDFIVRNPEGYPKEGIWRKRFTLSVASDFGTSVTKSDESIGWSKFRP